MRPDRIGLNASAQLCAAIWGSCTRKVKQAASAPLQWIDLGPVCGCSVLQRGSGNRDTGNRFSSVDRSFDILITAHTDSLRPSSTLQCLGAAVPRLHQTGIVVISVSKTSPKPLARASVSPSVPIVCVCDYLKFYYSSRFLCALRGKLS